MHHSLLYLAFAVVLGLPSLSFSKDTITVVKQPSSGKGHYTGNAQPLTPSHYIKLPIRAIKPGGWLLKQLKLEANGFTGHLDQLSGFLKKEGNAWLAPDGKGVNGWEEVPYWMKGFGDLGYVLGDKRIIKEAEVWIEAAIKSQRPNGYFGPESNLTNADGKPDLWPNMPMINALQSYYEYCGDKRVLTLMERYFKWQLTVPDADFLVNAGAGYWQNQRGGDNLASIYWLYNRTQETWLLELAGKTHRCTADWTTGVPNWHGVNFAQSFREPTTYWQQSQQEKHFVASKRDLETFRAQFGQVPGGMYGADENARTGYIDPRQSTETCAFVEMMYADEMLLLATSDLSWADHCEDVAFNSFPASMTSDLKALRYLTAPNQVQSDKANKAPGIQNSGPMYHYDPYDHRCCQHNVAMGWPYFAEHLWMATADNGLVAMFYSESEVKAKVGGGREVTIKETTKYPFRDKVDFKIAMSAPTQFPLYLRVPAWCVKAQVLINGKSVQVQSQPGKLMRIDREWMNGDSVSLTLPMKVKTTRYAANMNSVSVQRGPLTYSLKIVEKSKVDGGTKTWPAFSVFPESVWNYGLVLDGLKKDDIKVTERAWPRNDQPFEWNTAPIEIKVKARRIDAWKADELSLVGRLQPSPAKVSTPIETITLIPMGCARLRISAFPTVTTDESGTTWKMPKDLILTEASYVNSNDTLSACSDGILPNKSNDQSIPRFTWWDHKGTSEWVQYNFEKPRKIQSASVFWFDDAPNGFCRAPQSWSLQYWQDGKWKAVETSSEYGLALDVFNTVTFSPITTTKLRLNLNLLSGFSSGMLEWVVK